MELEFKEAKKEVYPLYAINFGVVFQFRQELFIKVTKVCSMDIVGKREDDLVVFNLTRNIVVPMAHDMDVIMVNHTLNISDMKPEDMLKRIL